MTTTEIMAWAKRVGETLSREEAGELVGAAIADGDEGSEWLPWYKMALAKLASCVGSLDAMLSPAGLLAPNPGPAIEELRRDWRLHLLLCGVGPRTDAGVEAAIRAARTAPELLPATTTDFVGPGGLAAVIAVGRARALEAALYRIAARAENWSAADVRAACADALGVGVAELEGSP